VPIKNYPARNSFLTGLDSQGLSILTIEVKTMLFDLKVLPFFRKIKTEVSPWWIEVITHQPACTYYFGPYGNRQAAAAEQQGFVEDLQSEHAVGIRTCIKRTQPEQLTIVQSDSSR
jgi:hypothetical protein